MFNTWTLMWGVFFGAIGLGFFVYGKKKGAIVPIISGMGLMIFPYCISNPYFMVLAGVVLIALPWFFKE
ncbi:MAG: hypothetical protein QM498_04680 [Desulfobacterium sp.]